MIMASWGKITNKRSQEHPKPYERPKKVGNLAMIVFGVLPRCVYWMCMQCVYYAQFYDSFRMLDVYYTSKLSS